MGWQEVFGLNKAIQNRSIIKDHLIFKDQQYQKHKVEYKKIVFYKYDLIKAVYSYSPTVVSMNLKRMREDTTSTQDGTQGQRSQHASEWVSEPSEGCGARGRSVALWQKQPRPREAFCFLWGRVGEGKKDC